MLSITKSGQERQVKRQTGRTARQVGKQDKHNTKWTGQAGEETNRQDS